MSQIGLSLKQLLKDVDLLAQAKVVCGTGGLDRPVQWPQIADIPGMTDWLRDGELLLTTTFALQESAVQQRTLINTLAEKGVAGMVVSVGRFFEHIPLPARLAADAVDFPIIELPWQVSLLETAKQISQSIIAQQTELLNHSIKIHQTLTQFALQNSSLDVLAQALVQLLKRPVIIEDTSLRTLAFANFAQKEDSQHLSLYQLKASQTLINHLQDRGILADLQRSPRPMRVGAIQDEDQNIERIITPIMVGNEILGYVWVIVGENGLTHLDYIAIEHTATVIALIMTRQRAVQQAAQQRYSNLLDHLLTEGVVLTERLLFEARQLGLDPHHPYQVLLIRGVDLPPELLSDVDAALRQAFQQAQQQPLLTNKRDNLVMIMTESDASFVREVLDQFCVEDHMIMAGLSTTSNSLAQLHRSYQEALEITEIATILELDGPIVAFDELGLMHWLHQLPEKLYEENKYINKICDLAEYDVKHRSEFLGTLETYLDQGANASAAAQSLHLHRSTLLYRLEKCQTICAVDLSSSLERLNLHVALKAWRIHSYNV